MMRIPTGRPGDKRKCAMPKASSEMFCALSLKVLPEDRP
jgi:hypothetical protein